MNGSQRSTRKCAKKLCHLLMANFTDNKKFFFVFAKFSKNSTNRHAFNALINLYVKSVRDFNLLSRFNLTKIN